MKIMQYWFVLTGLQQVASYGSYSYNDCAGSDDTMIFVPLDEDERSSIGVALLSQGTTGSGALSIHIDLAIDKYGDDDTSVFDILTKLSGVTTLAYKNYLASAAIFNNNDFIAFPASDASCLFDQMALFMVSATDLLEAGSAIFDSNLETLSDWDVDFSSEASTMFEEYLLAYGDAAELVQQFSDSFKSVDVSVDDEDNEDDEDDSRSFQGPRLRST
mmetsp:Transcript_42644/g.86222  ORF Transcript_42644/g.86222 Transcript_42644/m.86222 type:complete len:217 (+) Transcript_42644:155-805(+)